MDEIGFNFRGGWHTQSFHLKVAGRNTFVDRDNETTS